MEIKEVVSYAKSKRKDIIENVVVESEISWPLCV
jgi:hypothetical protein